MAFDAGMVAALANELNNKLRKKFNYYEFINLSKLNGNLIINIVKNDSNIKSEEKNTDKIVSNKDAYILKIQISSGNRNVELFQMVKKGDILISGESCKGYVIGRTIEIVDYKIPKVYKKILYTNNYYKNRYIKYKDQNKEFSIPFNRYYLMRNVIYKIGNFSLVEDVYFEQVEALIEYSIFDIEYYLYDYIKYLFYSNHHYEEEKIIDIKIVSKKEDEKFFYIKTINTALEELGQV